MSPAASHPDDDALEEYSLGRTAASESTSIREHLLVCRSCRARLAELEHFVQAMRGAAEDLFEGVAYRHQTAGGEVLLEITRSKDGWQAALWGEDVEAMRIFNDPRDAQRYLTRVFREMFPEHRCTRACGPAGK